MNIPSQFPINQDVLASRLSLDNKELCRLRDSLLLQKRDWIIKGKTILWSEAAVAKVQQALLTSSSPEVAVEGVKHPEPPVDLVAELRHETLVEAGKIAPPDTREVLMVRYIGKAANPKMILGELDGKRIGIYIGKGRDYFPIRGHSMIPVKLVNGTVDQYELGRQAPRSPGKW